MSKKKNYVWRVTSTESGGIDLSFGPKLSEAPGSDTAKIQVLGRRLIELGTQLMNSATRDDDDWDDEE